MARSSKEKFYKLLEAKGVDRNDPSVTEFINDYDGDFAEMNRALQEQQKAQQVNQQWAQWYQQRGYMVDSLEQETAQLRSQLDRVRQAGIRLDDQDADTAQRVQQGEYVTAEALQSLKQEIFGTFSAVTKDLLTVQGEHFKQFGEAPDLEEIEKIVTAKNIPVRAAYDQWVSPRREELRKLDQEKEIKRRVEEALRDERSKMGVARTSRKQSDAVSPMADMVAGKRGPKEEAQPRNTVDRLNKFISDLNSVEPSTGGH
jgi:hypothetical protein